MQSRLLVVLGLALAACTTDLAGSEARTWTDTTGKYKTEAEFVDLKDGKVQLKTADGSLKLVPLEKLSEPDKEYVQRRATDGGSKVIKVVVKEIYNCDGVHVPGTSFYIQRLSDVTLRADVVRMVQPMFASVGWKVAESEEEESDGTLTVQIHGWQERVKVSSSTIVVIGGDRDGETTHRMGGTGFADKLGGTISLLGHRQRFGDSGRSTVRRTSQGKKLKGEMERRRKAAEHEIFSGFCSVFESCNFIERLSYVVSRAAGVGQTMLLLEVVAAMGEEAEKQQAFNQRAYNDGTMTIERSVLLNRHATELERAIDVASRLPPEQLLPAFRDERERIRKAACAVIGAINGRNTATIRGKFSLGNTGATGLVFDRLSAEEIMAADFRHSFGDWGDVSPEEWEKNNVAMRKGQRLRSVYHTAENMEFWVITLADRSGTIQLLPSEYEDLVRRAPAYGE